jgi:hydrogenase maturation protease
VTEADHRRPVLVIGYGNDLRSDDGVGRWVADQIGAMDLPNVEVLSIIQLTPEIALDVVDRRLVVFVDASVDAATVSIRDVEPEPLATVMTHHGDPARLLSLSSMLGAAPERSMLVSIPAPDLGMGSSFSPRAEAAARDALDRILTPIATTA